MPKNQTDKQDDKKKDTEGGGKPEKLEKNLLHGVEFTGENRLNALVKQVKL